MVYFVTFPSKSQIDDSKGNGDLTWKANNSIIATHRLSDEARGVVSSCFGQAKFGFWSIAGDIFSSLDDEKIDGERFSNDLISRPNFVCRHYWGRYGACVYDKKANHFIVLVDPCGQFPLYYRRMRNGEVHFASKLQELLYIGGSKPEPDIPYLHAYMHYGYGESTRTGWKNIDMLEPGRALIVASNRPLERPRLWSPGRRPQPSGTGDFIARLGGVLAATMPTNSRVILELSGGVESSALAVALEQQSRQDGVVAVTYFDPSRSASNEVDIAQQVARACGLRHEVFPLLQRLPFAPSMKSPITARPSMELCFLAQIEAFAEAGLSGADVTRLNGHGGDALFLAPPPFGVALDAMSRGRLARAMAAVRDLAFTYRMPVWQVLRELLSDASRYLANDVGPIASPSVIRVQPPPPLGLFDDILRAFSLRLQPGRRCQIVALNATIDETSDDARQAAALPLRPFLTQPIVEWALRARPEDLFSAFSNRLPIREATYRAKPLPSVWRTDKGDTTHTTLLGLHRHRNYVREICLEGKCASDGSVDRAGMEKLLNRAALGYAEGLHEITRVFAVEMFLNSSPSGEGADHKVTR
ncbi:asparagine synthase-related protein [Trinickia sp.]|uniref:asparagine synthase-related protein n=1 Tax=Trinickia sp. TaxID=2571163 RepID=UPI003F7F1015